MKQVTQKEEVSKQAMQQDNKKPLSQGLNPYVKGILYISGVVFTLWASTFVFSAFAGAIRAFKDLRKSIGEK
jgi:hypothetical protein